MHPTEMALTAAPTTAGSTPGPRRALTPASPDERRLATRLIATFLALTALFSAVWYFLMIRAGTIQAAHGLYVLGMMWSPGLGALISRLVWQRNLRGQGWGWGATRWQLLAYGIPVLYATVAYGAVWLLGLGAFRAPADVSIVRRLVTIATLGTVMSSVSALGEELGWRGLLVPELAKLTSFTRLSLLSGAIWAAWHMPAIFLLDYNAGGTPHLYAAGCFAVMVMGIAFVFAWLRLRSGSVWTGMFLHASHNLWIQGFFDRPVDHLYAAPVLTSYFREKKLDDVVVVSPDVGAAKMARGFARRLDSSFAIIDKRRPAHNVAEVVSVVGDVANRTCIVVDDLIDTAGTLESVAIALKERGAKTVFAAATHALLSGPAVERLTRAPIEEVVVTNTLLVPEEKRFAKLKVLSVGPLLARAIWFTHSNESVSQLFD